MSGSPTAQWVVPPHQRDLAKKQAELVGCPTHSISAIVSCLRTIPWQELADSIDGFAVFGWDPVLRWKPVVEPDLGQPRFLPATPEELISKGRVHDVPLMLGVNQLEFIIIANVVLRDDTLREEMHQNWTRIAPISFLLDLPEQRAVDASLELYQDYIGNRPFAYNNDTAFALGRLYGDTLAFGVHRFSRLMSKHLSSPIYYYKFNYTGAYSFATYPDTATPIGATHHDELIYLFYIPAEFPFIDLDFRDSEMVDKMTTMWTNFVIRGRDFYRQVYARSAIAQVDVCKVYRSSIPLGDNDQYKCDPNRVRNQPALTGLRWPKLEPKTRKHLLINERDFEVRSRTDEDRFAIWERLFPLNDEKAEQNI